MNQIPKLKRILLKLSGESLLGTHSSGLSVDALKRVAGDLIKLQKSGIELAVVLGGGNLFRGVTLEGLGMARTPADQMGMLATIMNGLALQQAIEAQGTRTILLTALECPAVAKSFHWRKAQKHLERGEIVICVGGTGHPYFTTDTAAALRASEIEADLFVKATKVDGIYNKDPLKHPDAIFYPEISYERYLEEQLGVMDSTAISLCKASEMPIFVCNMKRLFQEPLKKLIDERKGSFVK